jgi:hypothetical protein
MLKQQVEAELKNAMKNREALRLSVFRMLSTAIHNREIEKRTRVGTGKETPLEDEEILQVIRSEVKKRKDAADAYAEGKRPELAEKEKAEANILLAFLPAELLDEEIERVVAEGIAALGVASEKEFGKLIGWVKQRVGARASGERVAAIVKRKLSAA